LRAAAIFWFLLSSGGVVLVLLVAVVWLYVKSKSRVPRAFLALVVLGYTAASIYPIPHAVERWLGSPFHPLTRVDVPPGRSVVVLLGSGSHRREDWSDVKLSVLDPAGLERTLEAARVYRLLQADLVISSGGVIEQDDPEDPVGDTMKDTLVRLGVPPDRIIVERDSTNTREEAVMVAAMLPSLDVKHVILVTSPMHMRRAVGMFRAVGVEVIPAIARQREYSGSTISLAPTETGLRTSALAAHELVGLTYYRLRGWYKSR
jgi:uncharacterized SAM-binding protein YcdF (DUF218 family)